MERGENGVRGEVKECDQSRVYERAKDSAGRSGSKGIETAIEFQTRTEQEM